MPRGRPRKSALSSSSSSSSSPSNDAGAAATFSRPVRNRIAVRKFGTAPASEQECLDEDFASSVMRQLKQTSTSEQSSSGYVMIHKSFWNHVCTSFACSSCGKKNVQMKTEKLAGLACKLIMYCTACGVVLSQVTSSPEGNTDSIPQDNPDYEVNRRFVKFFVSEGKNYDDVVVFSKTLGIPCISKQMFEKYSQEILAAGILH